MPPRTPRYRPRFGFAAHNIIGRFLLTPVFSFRVFFCFYGLAARKGLTYRPRSGFAALA